MSTYCIGMIVCCYAVSTWAIKDWMKDHPEAKQVPIGIQLSMIPLVIVVSLIWPLVLAVWMRDIKKPQD